jgi:hypothetical protein
MSVQKTLQMAHQENTKRISNLSLQEATETLEGLNPIKFHYKAEQEKDLHLGFIAEDALELVATTDRKGLSAMDIVAVLTKVVQQQQAALKEQQAEIAALKAILHQLTQSQ